ncbi:MAG: phasin family protein [Betaproteobacteria bacterium]|nr:phasin family protein [Betaproteobacteria bacterium]
MAKKPAPPPADETPAPPLQAPGPNPMSTHQIWLAGLGAMAQAQAQGSKAFETLVSDGLAFQHKHQQQAQARFAEATERLSQFTQNIGQQASGRIDKLEHVFEERVARALHRLGMPTLQDMADLQARVADLEGQLAAHGKAGNQASQTPARKRPRKA